MRLAIMFNSDYFNGTKPEDAYFKEYEQALCHGMNVLLCSIDGFLENGKLRIKAAEEPISLIYRGWMLTVVQYTLLFDALQAKGYTLINTPEQYRQCHYFPYWYDVLQPYTAESVYIAAPIERQHIINTLHSFGKAPLIVKDYVKSRKHEWNEACFIPDAADTENALAVIDCFTERQGTDLCGGIVLRKYLSLEMIGAHDKSNMPIAKEIRVFCFRHKPFATISYWSGEDAMVTLPDTLIQACRALNSNFYTIDMALTTEGQWIIIEVGDGQVSGLQGYDEKRFYENMIKCLAFNS